MKSIKKRCKLLLSEIAGSAHQLAIVSADLTLLSEIQQIAEKVLNAEAALNERIAVLKKDNFIAGIVDSQALAELEDILDIDAVSMLEESLFAALNNQDDRGGNEFLQEFLAKIDKSYTKMLTDIQLLTALLEED